MMTRSIRQKIEKRLLKKRIIDSNGCWIFTGHLNNKGYGVIHYDQGHIFVHRLSMKLYRSDEYSDNLNVLHKCDIRKCFNPEHLFMGTQSDNIRDCVVKGRHKSGFAGDFKRWNVK